MAIGILIFIIIVVSLIIGRRKNLIRGYVQENSQYYHSLMKLKTDYGLMKPGLDYDIRVQDIIRGNRKQFNKFLEFRPHDAVYQAIMNRNKSIFTSYTQWRNEVEAISNLKSDWNAYVKSHRSNRWEDMKPKNPFIGYVSANRLYKVEANLIMSELNISKPTFKLMLDVKYVTPGGRDTHHWRKEYVDSDFAPIVNIWHNSVHQKVVEKPKSQLVLPPVIESKTQQQKDDVRLSMDYMNSKHKARIQARVDKVLEAQKRFEAELSYNNETLKLAEEFDELLRKYSKSLVYELSETKVSIALTQVNTSVEFVNFKKRFRKFREHSVNVRKTFYNKMLARYKNHQPDVIRFTKLMNANVDEINHAAFSYIELLVKDYSYGSKKDLSFCDARPIAKMVRLEFDAKKIRYGSMFKDDTQESLTSVNQAPTSLDADVYDAMMKHVDFPDEVSSDYVQAMPDAVATYRTVQSSNKLPDNVIQMKPEVTEASTSLWEHEFDDYDFDVSCEFSGFPYKDETYKQLVEAEANRLGISVGILNRMRFYSLAQYLMLKSSHMLNESVISEKPMVYIIYNKSKDLVYVGQASQGFAKRFEEHLHSYHNNIAHNGSSTTGSYLWNRDLLAGDDIYFSFITVFDDFNNPGYTTMDSLENAFIHIFHSNQKEYGYNQKLGNGSLQTATGRVIAY